MTLAQLSKRIEALELELAQLKKQMQAGGKDVRPWWQRCAGRFADDPEFEDMVRYGREYRESLRPKPPKHGSRKGKRAKR